MAVQGARLLILEPDANLLQGPKAAVSAKKEETQPAAIASGGLSTQRYS